MTDLVSAISSHFWRAQRNTGNSIKAGRIDCVRRDLRRVEYGDERIPEMREFLTKISPVHSAHRINKPMYIVQGTLNFFWWILIKYSGLNDPRVPAGESQQIADAVRKNGVDVWYLLAKDEGHGFRKKANAVRFV